METCAEPSRRRIGPDRPAHPGPSPDAAAGADVTLDPAVLDRIDEIVTPGTVINPADTSFANPAPDPAARRR